MARKRTRAMSPQQAIGRAVTRQPRGAPKTAAGQMRTLEQRYGRAEAARRAGVSERTWRRWRAGGTPSKSNAARLATAARPASINPIREARLRSRGAYVRMTGDLGGGTPGARRKNERQRTIGGEGASSIYLDGEKMSEILDAWERGSDQEAGELLRAAIADEYGWPTFTFGKLTGLEFLRGDPNG
jgi:hypothetical protein